MKFLHIISRSQAINNGLDKYFTGQECKNGHLSERRVKHFKCIDCYLEFYRQNKAHLNELNRINHHKRKDEINEMKRRQYAENPEIKREKNRARYEENKEEIKEKHRRHYIENREKIRRRGSEYYQENKERIYARFQEYAKHNKDKLNARAAKRRAMTRGASGKFTDEDVARMLDRQKGKCASCTLKLKTKGKDKFHVDHIVPLAKGGSNWPENLQLLCPKCNKKKGAKCPFGWAKENGRLL